MHQDGRNRHLINEVRDWRQFIFGRDRIVRVKIIASPEASFLDRSILLKCQVAFQCQACQAFSPAAKV